MKVRIINDELFGKYLYGEDTNFFTIEMPCVPRVGETICTQGEFAVACESPEWTVTHVIYNIRTDEQGKEVYDGVDVYVRMYDD